MASGGNGGDSTVVYNSVTYTANGGTGADPADGSNNSFDVAPAHSGGSGTGGLAILGGGSMGGGSGQTIYGNYSCTPIDGRNGGMLIVQVAVVSGQTTYAVTVGSGGTAATATYGTDQATGTVGSVGMF